MSKKRIIIALGHKDLGMNLPEQYQAVRKTAKMISEFVKKGYQIGIVFSNAPQVGMIHTAMMDLAWIWLQSILTSIRAYRSPCARQ